MNKQITLSLAVVVMAMAGISTLGHAQCPEHKVLMDRLDKAMAEKDASILAEVYQPNAKRHHPEGTTEGIAKIQEEAKQFYADVPDAKGETVDLFCAGDKIVARWIGTGTPKGSPRKVNVTGITIYHLQDGKIIEEWEELNSMSMMMQLGFTLTPPAEAGNE